MDFSIGFLILMVLLSGAIAYFGDLFGRYLGKKRKTLFRMRPRHFAAFATAISGSLATLLVIVILVSLSQQVRTWIFESGRLQSDLTKQRSQLSATQKDLAEQKKLLAAADEKYKDTDKLLKDAVAKYQKEVTNANEAKLAAQKLRSQADKLESSITKLNADITRVNAQVTQRETDLKDTQTRFDAALKQYNEVVQQNSALDIELEAKKSELEQKQNELIAARAEAEGLKRSLAGLQESIKASTDRYTQELNKNREDLAAAQAELTGVQTDLSRARQELSDAQNTLSNAQALLRFTNAAARYTHLVANTKDELVRIPIEPFLNQAEARRLLLAAIDQASTEARVLGATAKDGSPGVFAAFSEGVMQNGLPVSPQAQFDLAVTRMAGGTEPRFAILRTPINTFDGEFIPLEVEIHANPVIYTAGATIIETRIDGSQPPEVIARDITTFVQTELQKKVLADGVIPALGKPNPLGELSSETILRLVDQLRLANRPMRVQFITQKGVRAGDQLSLDFRLRL